MRERIKADRVLLKRLGSAMERKSAGRELNWCIAEIRGEQANRVVRAVGKEKERVFRKFLMLGFR